MSADILKDIDSLRKLTPAWLSESLVVTDAVAVFERFESRNPGKGNVIKISASLAGLAGYSQMLARGPFEVVKETYEHILGSEQMFSGEGVFWLPQQFPGLVMKQDIYCLATTTLLCMSILPQIVNLETAGYVIEPVKTFWAFDGYCDMGSEGVLVMEQVLGAVDYDDAPSEVQKQMWRASMDVGSQFERVGIPVITDFDKYDVLWRGRWKDGKPILAIVDLGTDETEKALLER